MLREFAISDIVHCAGSLSYFNVNRLRQGNPELTQSFLDLSVQQPGKGVDLCVVDRQFVTIGAVGTRHG